LPDLTTVTVYLGSYSLLRMLWWDTQNKNFKTRLTRACNMYIHMYNKNFKTRLTRACNMYIHMYNKNFKTRLTRACNMYIHMYNKNFKTRLTRVCNMYIHMYNKNFKTHQKPRMNSVAPEGLLVLATLMAHVAVTRHEHHKIWISCWTPICANKYTQITYIYI
jgi:hypothetical protein